MSVRLEAIIHGRVQGVNFRNDTVQQAKSLGLVGYVRNLTNGTVETIAEGPQDQLETLVEFLKTGPAAAQVTHVDIQWETATESFTDFSIRY